MNITLMAHDKKKELMVQFCTAYKSILSKHSISATATTGRLVAEATGLPVSLFLSKNQGGHQQIDAWQVGLNHLPSFNHIIVCIISLLIISFARFAMLLIICTHSIWFSVSSCSVMSSCSSICSDF